MTASRPPAPGSPVDVSCRYLSPAPAGPPVAMFTGGFGLGPGTIQPIVVPSWKFSIVTGIALAELISIRLARAAPALATTLALRIGSSSLGGRRWARRRRELRRIARRLPSWQPQIYATF